MPDLTTRKAQLDSNERKHLESVVKQLRTRAEKDARYWIEDYFALKKEDAEAPSTLTNREQMLRRRLREAIAREQAGGRSWAKARKLYIKGVGYTLVNRLAALRCMEVRGFLDRAVTRFREDGRTPAADPLIDEHFLAQGEGIWMAFLQACHQQAQEIEILFDLSDPYSLLMGDVANWDGDVDTAQSWSRALLDAHVEALQELGSLLDEVDDAVWRADDVLGWVYEYYNLPDLDAVRLKADTKGLEPEDVPSANQFYTQHWVVRMLTDNSLGKLFLEHEGTLLKTIERQQTRFSLEERKTRDPETAASIEELCTYIVATEMEGEATDFNHPTELRVLDPACGSAHFLLYAFDVMERIWWAMEPGVPRKDVPALILQHNLFGVDLDLRACQLAAFTLYLKARSRAEYHGATSFNMPMVGIVCADAHVADLDHSHEVFSEVSAGNEKLRKALGSVLTAFEQVEGLGSLLDVKGTLAELVDDPNGQLDIFEDSDAITLPELLGRLQEAVATHIDGASFRAKDLRSFLRLLVLLSQSYDVTLMNPPFGMRGRMPGAVKSYVKDRFSYAPEYAITFFEQAERVTKLGGRVGMLTPRSFMFKRTFEDFRINFVAQESVFDLLAEYGLGVLDNATVRTAGTIVRVGVERPNNYVGIFYRLHDVDEKEKTYLKAAFLMAESDMQRKFEVSMEDFSLIPGSPLSYWIPKNIRKIYESGIVFDRKNAKVDREGHGAARQGIGTGDNDRFMHSFWCHRDYNSWVPLATGGEDSWGLPRMTNVIEWGNDGVEVRRFSGGNGTPNEHLYFREGLAFNQIKEGGRRFGYLHEYSIFSHTGMVYIPYRASWATMAFANSALATYLMVGLTTGRHWNVGEVAKLPWDRELEEREDLSSLAMSVTSSILSLRQFDFRSPHYQRSLLLSLIDASAALPSHARHPHRDLSSKLNPHSIPTCSRETTIEDLAVAAEKFRQHVQHDINRCSRKVDDVIYGHFGLTNEDRKLIELEIALRTSEDPRVRQEYDPASVTEPPEDLSELVERLLLHLVFEVLEEDHDGIVLIGSESDDEGADLLARMITRFESIWGEYAQDRLNEVDEILGNRTSQKEAYPNLRYWLENKLFTFHCSQFENTPILWQLTTERLVSGSKGTGLSCIVDYHQLGPDFFDKLSVRYIEPRKAVLRERRRAANSASGDPGAAATVRARAREEVERYDDALRQIDALESALRELSQSSPRPWASEVQTLAQETAPKVRRFRRRLQERLRTLDRLHEVASMAWFKDQFSNKFMESVNGNREEWIDALKDLEAACEQFAQPATEPVEAHLYDLLPYFNKLVGSTHYRSNGIFFLNYYFSKGKKLAAKMASKDESEFTEQERLVAALARETDADVALGKEIKAACKEMAKPMDADWKVRALEEVMTAGYRPVKKHGVAINITPLAEKKLVPKIVEDKVL